MPGPKNLILMLIAIAGFSCAEETTVSKTVDWPTGTPGWHYRTHSVLEQMYEKL